MEQSVPELEAQMGTKGDRRAALAMYQEDRVNELVHRLPVTQLVKTQITVPA
jgi:hypothetical protein